ASMAIQSYRDLEAWKVGMEFAVRVCRITKSFPEAELYGPASQLRRAAAAIPSNLSEGHRRGPYPSRAETLTRPPTGPSHPQSLIPNPHKYPPTPFPLSKARIARRRA